ncbi:hypothetical protein [uncultured Roseibium sp.]|uniref:hypothetical protein n=1 Tax=uncultured Roseibium sp. TaxID=1936171 RepID=UPI0026319452|nr:hypothetical protein [uncultured Roseibium sp.]
MYRIIRSSLPAARGLKTGLHLAAVLTSALGMAACQQYQTPSDLLFAPGFSTTRQSIPYTYNTPYDCRNFSGSGWKAIASGLVHNFGDQYRISQAGCFKTQSECQAYLSVMHSYIDVPRFMRCNPYTA